MEDIPVLGCRDALGVSDVLHHEGKPMASLFRMMKSETLDQKVAGVGPVRCRREPRVSPITRAAGGEGTGGRGRKPDASPDCHTERG